MTRWRRAAASLLIGALIYFNVAAVMVVCDVRLPRPHPWSSRWVVGPFPNHWVTERMFRMFDLFDRWAWQNWGFGAYGSRSRLDTPPATPGDDLVPIDVYDYFPQQRGEQNRRIYLLSYRNNPQRLKEEYAKMADVLQRLHNEANPAQRVEQVFVYQYSWKKGKEGYLQNFADRKTELAGHN